MPTTDIQTSRETLAEVIFHTKSANLDKTQSAALADAITAGLARRGWVVAEVYDVIEPPDEHLRTLKSMRRVIAEAVNSGETAARDLASLTRRLQDVSREVTTIEERHRGEKKGKPTNGNNGHSSGTAGGPLDI